MVGSRGEEFKGPENNIGSMEGQKKKALLVGSCSAPTVWKGFFSYLNVAKAFAKSHMIQLHDNPLSLVCFRVHPSLIFYKNSDLTQDSNPYQTSMDRKHSSGNFRDKENAGDIMPTTIHKEKARGRRTQCTRVIMHIIQAYLPYGINNARSAFHASSCTTDMPFWILERLRSPFAPQRKMR